MKVLIVGAGITGTLLAWRLLKKNIDFELWANPQIPSASQTAAGLINPITGKRLAKLENYDLLLHCALNCYHEIENFFHVPLVYPHKIYRFIDNPDLFKHYQLKQNHPEYLHFMNLKTHFSIDTLKIQANCLQIEPAYRVNLVFLLELIHEYLKKSNRFFHKHFNEKIPCNKFDKIFLCRGYQEAYFGLFPGLKWENALGEIIIFHAPALNLGEIVQFQKLTLIPLGYDYYWLGATYLRETDFSNYYPTKELEDFLSQFLKVPYRIIQKSIGIRPILKERKPLFLQSAHYSNVFMVNGMGSKGTLLAPYVIENQILNDICT